MQVVEFLLNFKVSPDYVLRKRDLDFCKIENKKKTNKLLYRIRTCNVGAPFLKLRLGLQEECQGDCGGDLCQLRGVLALRGHADL